MNPDQIIFMIGSAGSPRRPRNPLTYPERKLMLGTAIRNDPRLRDIWRDGCIHIVPVRDTTYNNEAWIVQVQQIIATHQDRIHDDTTAVLLGYAKDPSTNYYLRMFHAMYDTALATPFLHDGKVLDATTIRNNLYDATTVRHKMFTDVMPDCAVEYLHEFVNRTGEYLVGYSPIEYLRRDVESIKDYRKGWLEAMRLGLLKWEPTFNTVDSVLICAGHILMIERGAWPGKGLYAFPGGYVKPREYLIQGAVRELREETKINVDVPEKVLMGSLRHVQQFDEPNRSERGRLFTTAHLFHLPPPSAGHSFPTVEGADDAARADWMMLDEPPEERCFEDHYHIKNVLRGYLKDYPL